MWRKHAVGKHARHLRIPGMIRLIRIAERSHFRVRTDENCSLLQYCYIQHSTTNYTILIITRQKYCLLLRLYTLPLMNEIILVISILFLFFVFRYDQNRWDRIEFSDPSVVARNEFSSFILSLIVLITLSVIVGFGILQPWHMIGAEGVTIAKRIGFVFLFVCLILLPSLNILFGLSRLGANPMVAKSAAAVTLFAVEWLLHYKGFFSALS